MCTSARTWDNDLVNQKEEQMKPIEITKQDQFGYERKFIIRHDNTSGKMFLAEIDPDLVSSRSAACSVPLRPHSTALRRSSTKQAIHRRRNYHP